MALNDRVGRAMAKQVKRVNGSPNADDSLVDLLRQVEAERDRLAAQVEYYRSRANGDVSANLPPPEERDYLTVAEVKAQTGASYSTVCRWCTQKKIKAELIIPPVGVKYWQIAPNQVYPKRYARKMRREK